MEHTPQFQTMVLIPQTEWIQQKELMQFIKDKIEKMDISSLLTPHDYMTVAQVLQCYSMKRTFFEKLKTQGDIITYKIRGKIYVKRDEIQAFFKNSKQ